MLARITKLASRNRLYMNHLPLPPKEAAVVRGLYPAALAKLLDDEVFEFTWEGAGIRIDEREHTHYPTVTDDEVREAIQCPVPHDKIVIQTRVPREGCDEENTFLWYVEATPHGYTAIPFVFTRNTLSYFAATLRFDRRQMESDGTPVFDLQCPISHEKLYDREEFLDHHAVLLRFFRLLCLPRTEIETVQLDPRLLKARTRRGRPLPPPRRVVRISAEALKQSLTVKGGAPSERAPAAAHHRRAHTRTLPSGRVIPVRRCIVNSGQQDTLPPPQRFQVAGTEV